ncbi:MAG: type II toxin-antitoxin system RatA family toxin [Gammaproteobacteria bacterium]|nr:type II toxin-antitoxin system RatA family toxin [Gammaproteobacteria bacterium]MDD9894403.1 type II toxin-antitoxin system RatA family toxin [Gammaproteobacteria bacterium]MDD9960335.1 type II toxin-antitoxin system RatA family toxin [Gammaproteobacteria bacterium]
MTSINRSALVEYSSEQMFDLVNDIEKYPTYMDGCREAIVLAQSEDELTGKLVLSKFGIKQVFTTRNILNRPRSIDMELLEGNFKTFSSRWTFESLAEDACKVSLDMEFEFDLGLADYAAAKLLSNSANSLVDSLVARAKKIYGQDSG